MSLVMEETAPKLETTHILATGTFVNKLGVLNVVV